MNIRKRILFLKKALGSFGSFGMLQSIAGFLSQTKGDS